MAEPTFTQGDTVYSSDGQQAEYLMAHGDAHVVIPRFFRDDDIDEDAPARFGWAGEPTVWHQVFDKPPLPVIHEEVAAARAELEQLEASIDKAQRQLRELNDGERQRMARLKENRALARVDEWLAGKVTHFLVWERHGNRLHVQTWKEVMNDSRERGLTRSKIPLLVLGGSLEWDHEVARTHVDWYCVNDGDYLRVIPCASEDEAIALAREALTAAAAQHLAYRRGNGIRGYDHELENLVESFRKVELPLPGDLAFAYGHSRRVGTNTILENARKKVVEAQEALVKAEEDARVAEAIPHQQPQDVEST